MHLRLLGAGRCHLGLRLGLALQSGFQSGYSAADQLRVAASIGCLQRLGGVDDHAVTLAQRGFCLFTLLGFAVKGLVDGLAKGVPQFLFLAPVNRHLVGLRLPALLQRAYRINAQHRRLTQRLGFVNHGTAHFQALGLQGFQGRGGS